MFKEKYKDILFKAVIGVFVIMLTGLILLTIFSVVKRSLPLARNGLITAYR